MALRGWCRWVFERTSGERNSFASNPAIGRNLQPEALPSRPSPGAWPGPSPSATGKHRKYNRSRSLDGSTPQACAGPAPPRPQWQRRRRSRRRSGQSGPRLGHSALRWGAHRGSAAPQGHWESAGAFSLWEFHSFLLLACRGL